MSLARPTRKEYTLLNSVKARGDEKSTMAKKRRVRVAFFSAPVYDNVKFYMCAMESGVAFSYMMYYSRQ